MGAHNRKVAILAQNVRNKEASMTADNEDAYLDKVNNGTKQELDSFLTFFLWECPSSMIPSRREVQRWADALDKRGAEFVSDAKACRDWST